MTDPAEAERRGSGGPGPDGGLTAPAPFMVAVRATVNLDGLHAGEEAVVDARSPFMREMLAAQYLVPLPADRQPKGEVK